MKFHFLPFIRQTSMAIVLSCCISSLSAQQKPETLTNKSIIELSKAGLSNELIQSKINASSCKFDLSSNGLIDLKKQGIKDDVIAAMMAKDAGSDSPAASAGKGNAYHITMINHVHAVIDGQAKPLEKQTAGVRTKTKAFGYGGVASLLQINGKASPVRLSAAGAQKFVINTGGSAPELVLYSAKSNASNRQAESAKASMMGIKSGQHVITFSTAQVSNGVYEITIDKPLESGEYFFTGKNVSGASSLDAFAFGID